MVGPSVIIVLFDHLSIILFLIIDQIDVVVKFLLIFLD